jgi:hypothetical protein
MPSPLRAIATATIRPLAVAGAIAAFLGASTLPTAALADPPPWAKAYGWHKHHHHEDEDDDGPRAVYAPPPVVYAAPPPVVYAPPPVVAYPVAPSVNITIPLGHR